MPPYNVIQRIGFGGRLVLLAILEAVFYGVRAWDAGQHAWLLFCDPRILLFFVVEARGGPADPPTAASWAAVGLLAGLGIGVVRGWRWLGVYIVVEGLYAVLFLAFVALVLASHLSSPFHDFSIRVLLIPVLVFLFVSALPLWFAVRLWFPLGIRRSLP